MSLNFLALATRTLWPHSSSKRLTQGEWVPTSMAILREYSESKRCLRLSGVVRSLPSSMTSPLSVSIRHRWLYLSPRSSPAVISGRSLLPSVMGRFLLPLSLYGARTYCRPSRRVLRGGSAFSSHLRSKPLLVGHLTRVSPFLQDGPACSPDRQPCACSASPQSMASLTSTLSSCRPTAT